MQHKTRTKMVSATTANITDDIINRLRADGNMARRVNTVGVYDPVGKFYRTPKKGEDGISDVISCIKGVFVGWEVKKGKDRQRPGQKQFQKETEAAGGFYFLIKKQEDFFLNYELVLNAIKLHNLILAHF